MYLFKRELIVTASMEEKSKILQILSDNGIKYYVKTDDNFGGGLYSQRRLSGSFGMDMSCRFNYHIYVCRQKYTDAVALLDKN